MPAEAPLAKIAAVHEYGGEVELVDGVLEDAFVAATAATDADGRTLVHAYDDPLVIAGQGTAGLEILEQVPEVAKVIVPVGGGGLISGVATAVRALRPMIRIVGVEPAGADDAQRSFRLGSLVPYRAASTIADGLRGALSQRTLDIIRRQVDDIVTVSEDSIVRAMRLLWEQLKVTVEASSAVAYAAVLEQLIDIRGRRVGVVLTGGNVDLDSLPW
jgi:threonine dehydratase